MKKLWIPVLAAGAALALPLVAQDKKGDRSGDKADKRTDQADEKDKLYKLGSIVDEKLVLRDLDGVETTFKSLRGKVVFMHFWSVICPYEVAAEPKFKALQALYADKDVVLIAVNANQNEIGDPPPRDSDEPTYPKLRERIKDWKITYPVYVDHGNKLSALFQGRTTPHCFVIDPKGKIVYIGALDDDPKGDKGDEAKFYVRMAVDALLAGKEVEVNDTRPYG